MFRRPVFSLLALACGIVAQAQSHLVDVVYGHKMGVALTMDVFKPAKPNHIAVAFIVSGGWVSDHRAINPFLAKFFTDKGITVFEVVHGSQPKFQLPEIISDVNRAIRFIRTNAANYSVAPNKIGVTGMSAGGHLSLILGAFGGPGNAASKDPVERESSEVNAIACFYPPTDFLNWGKTGQSALEFPMLRVFWPAFGVTAQTSHETLLKMGRDFSPIYGITTKFPPTLIFHGDADTLVPIQQSELFMKKLESAGVPHRLVVKPGHSHGYPDVAGDLDQCADWFLKYLEK